MTRATEQDNLVFLTGKSYRYARTKMSSEKLSVLCVCSDMLRGHRVCGPRTRHVWTHAPCLLSGARRWERNTALAEGQAHAESPG